MLRIAELEKTLKFIYAKKFVYVVISEGLYGLAKVTAIRSQGWI